MYIIMTCIMIWVKGTCWVGIMLGKKKEWTPIDWLTDPRPDPTRPDPMSGVWHIVRPDNDFLRTEWQWPDSSVRFGLVWFGLVWCGLVWFGLVWFGFGSVRDFVYLYQSGSIRHGTTVTPMTNMTNMSISLVDLSCPDLHLTASILKQVG